jgi:hypothetical protein
MFILYMAGVNKTWVGITGIVSTVIAGAICGGLVIIEQNRRHEKKAEGYFKSVAGK